MKTPPILIITHPGPAHRDDFLACCLILALAVGRHIIIERRDPTPEEMENPNIWVVDTGGVYDPQKLCFDHHQMARGTRECALSLVAKTVGVEEALRHFPWYEATITLDCTGPYNLAKELGLPGGKLPPELYSPVEDTLLDLFAEDSPVDEDLTKVMTRIGDGIWRKALKIEQGICEIRGNSHSRTIQGLEVFFHYKEDPIGCREFLKEAGLSPAVIASPDQRGPGWGLYRHEDHPKIDFSLCASDPRVRFPHPNGFCLKTHERISEDEVIELVALAIKKDES